MIKLDVEYEIEHKIERKTISRILNMITRTVVDGEVFTIDSLKECEGLILDTIIDLEYKPSDKAQVQIEALGARVDEYVKYGINSLTVTFENQTVVFK